MAATLLRTALSAPARFAAAGRRDLCFGRSQPVSTRRLFADHPTGYLGSEPELLTWTSPAGQEVHFSLSGRSCMAVGMSGARSDTLQAFREAGEAAGVKRLLLFPVMAEDRAAVDAAGFAHMVVGEDARLDLNRFDLAGGRRADLRQMVNRARQRKVSVAEVDSAEFSAVGNEVYRMWLANRISPRPMRCLVGTPNFAEPLARRYFVALNGEGQPIAWVNTVPGFAGRGAGIDVMARDPSAVPGAMDLLLVEVAQRLAAEGLQTLSLGAVPLQGVERGVGQPLLRAICRNVRDGRLGNSLFPFAGLASFKAKFDPEWHSVCLGASPRIGAWALYESCRMWGLW
jgi:phosphatidylglycerol lysyltransferase